MLLSLALAGARATFAQSQVDPERVGTLVRYVKSLEVPQAAGTMASVVIMVNTAQSLLEDAPHFMDKARELVEEILREI